MYALLKDKECIAINYIGFENAVLSENMMIVEHDNPLVGKIFNGKDFIEKVKTTDELQGIEIQWRDAQLKSTDGFGLDDYPDNELRSLMRSYRQELRDYPSVDGFGDLSLRPVDPRIK